jgi:hypothetical protein
MKVIALHIFVRDKRKSETRRIIVKPSTQSIADMKLDIIKTIEPLKRKIEYYYVVVVVRKPNGKNGYRTVVPKQLVAA